MQRFLVLLLIKFLSVAHVHAFLPEESFDFIIAGGGTAGCVLARRLSDNGKFTVLLLERGEIADPILNIPALTLPNIRPYMKVYESVPQRNAALRNKGIIGYTVGRSLGGSSSVNGMVFNRGSPHDYDRWANISGDPSWSYENLMDSFRRIEDYHGVYVGEDSAHREHGSGGPITVSAPDYAPGLHEWLQAGRELGYQVADPNGPQRIGFSPMDYAKRFGRRVSAFRGYLEPALGRPNLKVITGAVVTRVIFDANKAIGVTFKLQSSGNVTSEVEVRAAREVVISSGVIESPAILMRSGIGPRDVLSQLEIPAVKYLPVGMNLHDHPAVELQIILHDDHDDGGGHSKVFNAARDLTPENLKLYAETGDGPFSSFYGLHGQAFLTSTLHEQEVREGRRIGLFKDIGFDEIPRDWPDIQLLQWSTDHVPEFIEFRNTTPIAPWEATIFNIPVVGRPRSRGRVTLDPKNPEGDPIIDFRYFEAKVDMDIMIDAIKKSLQIFEKTQTYQRLGARFPNTPLPACRHLKFRTDEYWKCFIRETAWSFVHAVGTCRMGSGPSDSRGVVDSSLKVVGVENLRVVDASIMPEVTNANTHAVVYVIAEKASEMILSEQGD